MNKVATRITIVFLLILLFLTGSYTFLHWNSNNSTLGWFRQECNKNYILIGEEVGAPVLNGVSKTRIRLYDNNNHRHVLIYDTSIVNKGKPLTDSNYSITNTEEYIKLNLYEYDHTPCGVYRFYYTDLNPDDSEEKYDKSDQISTSSAQ